MSRTKLGTALLASATVALGLLITSSSDAVTGGSDPAELLDPAFVARSACGLGAKHAATFKPMQLALAAKAAGTDDTSGPPLWDGLGDLSFAITTIDPLAQKYFDQGLRLTYAFNHAEADRAFRKARELDPNCAMCAWGEAFVLGANINAPMAEGAVQPAFVALSAAMARAARVSERERLLIYALAERYTGDPKADKAALALAYADAMAVAHERFPADPDVAVLFADAVMNTSPWDYWEADGRTPKNGIGAAIAAIEGVLALNPDHPGAIHLYIHLTEASARPERAEPYADRLAALMPGAGHVVHMPSHTYYRIGRYLDSLKTNLAAVEADEAFFAQAAASDLYAYGYYPHNIHFALVSAQMAGDAEHMLWAAERLPGKISDQIAAEIGWIQAILPAPYFAHAQFSAPDVVLGLADPGGRFPYVKGMWHYARGVALARQGELEAARTEAGRIAELARSADFSMLLAWAVPAPDLLSLARHVLEARIAEAAGDLDQAIEEFGIAVQIQDSLAYMEPPYWYYPVRQSLGAALLMANRADEAAAVFQQSLIAAPNNGWALFGLMAAQQAAGDQAGAALTGKLFERAWAGKEPPELARL